MLELKCCLDVSQMAYKKKFTPKKLTKKIYKKVYGSRTIPQALTATGKVAKDVAGLTASVAMIMSRLNVEKNYVDNVVTTISVGQANLNAEGYAILNVTPGISQGDGQGNRHGNSLKLTGISLPVQFAGELNCLNSRKLRMTLLRVRSADNGVTGQEAWEQYMDVNPLTGLRDYNAPRNYRSGSHDGVTCVRSTTYNLKAPTLLQGTTADYEQSCLSTKFNVKLQEIFRYATNADNFPDGISYYLIIQADCGNKSAVPSTLNIPVKAPFSGVEVRVSQRSWYVDN